MPLDDPEYNDEVGCIVILFFILIFVFIVAIMTQRSLHQPESRESEQEVMVSYEINQRA